MFFFKKKKDVSRSEPLSSQPKISQQLQTALRLSGPYLRIISENRSLIVEKMRKHLCFEADNREQFSRAYDQLIDILKPYFTLTFGRWQPKDELWDNRPVALDQMAMEQLPILPNPLQTTVSLYQREAAERARFEEAHPLSMALAHYSATQSVLPSSLQCERVYDTATTLSDIGSRLYYFKDYPGVKELVNSFGKDFLEESCQTDGVDDRVYNLSHNDSPVAVESLFKELHAHLCTLDEVFAQEDTIRHFLSERKTLREGAQSEKLDGVVGRYIKLQLPHNQYIGQLLQQTVDLSSNPVNDPVLQETLTWLNSEVRLPSVVEDFVSDAVKYSLRQCGNPHYL